MKKFCKIVVSVLLICSSLFMTACFESSTEEVKIKTREEIETVLPYYSIQVAVSATSKEEGVEENANFEITEIKAENGWVIIQDNAGFMYDKTTQKFYSIDVLGQTKTESTGGEDYLDQYGIFQTSYMGSSLGETLYMTNKGASSVAGRACTKYFQGANLIIVNAGYEVYIDNEYGILLKMAFVASSMDETGASASWEVTSIAQTGDISTYLAYTLLNNQSV